MDSTIVDWGTAGILGSVGIIDITVVNHNFSASDNENKSVNY